ncbi:MAG: zinc dependent phospholipase C family protein [Chloroflexota bacterium]|nr:zinc dependent phospholipase C family protein [Chloroflexota bacterium]MDE2910894.1 zinc dependent phospholipase C family protein [Chloroflexota bacterium]
MPTPFTHLRIAQELLVDELLPAHYRGLLGRQIPAFQLGGIVADARVASGLGREVTHFYAYGRPINEHPWRLMLRHHPELNEARDESHLAFLAGYVAHLAADEAWALKMARPQFWEREWLGVERREKFLALHLILTVMDERDQKILAHWQAESLERSEPKAWLPFMTDEVLRGWRDLVARQIVPGGESETLAIFGRRLNRDPAEIRAVLDDPALMDHHLWRHVPRSSLSLVERQTYAFTREQLAVYLMEYMPAFVTL